MSDPMEKVILSDMEKFVSREGIGQLDEDFLEENPDEVEDEHP